VARGKTSAEEINEINAYIGSLLKIDYFYTCFHDDYDMCKCRKPAPGLIYEAAEDLQIDVSNSILIGDRWKDIHAGQAAGCKSFFIDYSYPEKRPENPFTRVFSLIEAAHLIVRNANAEY
jgi:D-glycero-D-manno-heptose 1,7-bisphosphate phosphatase